MSAVILLNEADNVVVCCRALEAGEAVVLPDGSPVTVREGVGLGHKLARERLPAGAKVIKYGMAIGSTTQLVEAGGWVHLHNMRSDYMPAHTRTAGGSQ